MYLRGEPSNTLQKMGIHRTELEGLGGKTVLIYTDEKMVITIPDSINFTSLDVFAKTQDITLQAKNIHIKADTIFVEADDTVYKGNFTTTGGITSLNPDSN